MECGNLFCFWNQRNENPEKGFERRESTNKDFLTIKKEMLCSHSFQRKESVSLCWSRQLQGKDVTKKECGGEETTLIGVYAHAEVHSTKCSLHMQPGSSQRSLGDSIKFFLMSGGKKLPHQDRDNDSSIVVLHFAGHLPQFLNTLNWGTLSFHDKRQCTESVALRQVLAPPWAAPCAKWRTRFLRLRSRLVVFIWLLFVYDSPSVLFDHSHTSSFRVNHVVIFFWSVLFHSETLQVWHPALDKFFP